MNPLREWNRFWFGPISARPLGAFRVVLGVLILANLALLSFELDYWFVDTGLLRPAEARDVSGVLRPSILHHIHGATGVRAYFVATTAVAVLFTLGWRTRVMGVILYLLMLSIQQRNVVSNCGVDTLILVMLFYAMLSPCGAAYSLDARRRQRRQGIWAEPLVIPWAQRLIQLQLSLIYLNTAILKCNGSSWLGGTALHYVINNTEVSRPHLRWLSDYPLAINGMTYLALAAEFAIPFLLWFKPTRKWTALMGLGLHAVVLLTVNVPLFGEVMCACYLAFLDPDEVQSLVRMLNPREWFQRLSKASTGSGIMLPGRVDAPSGSPTPYLLDPLRDPSLRETSSLKDGVWTETR